MELCATGRSAGYSALVSAWIFSGGSGSCGPWRLRGTGLREMRPGISSPGCGRVAGGNDRIGGAGLPGPALRAAASGKPLAASTVVHAETVTRTFYAFHVERGSGPVVNPFPLARAGRPGCMRTAIRWSPFRRRSGPGGTGRGCRSGSRARSRTTVFAELFAALGSHRDRALVAFWISTGARAAELLRSLCARVSIPGQQLITVVRKGSRAVQQLPASPDAFVWLRLYQEQLHGLVPAGGG